MGFSGVSGIDFVLPAAPPLQNPPLSLLDLAPTLIDSEGLVADAQRAQEASVSAQSALADAVDNLRDGTAGATEALQEAIDSGRNGVAAAEAWATEAAKRLADVQRWEYGFEYLPELGIGALELFVPGQSAAKAGGSNQSPFLWYDPFTVVARDDRSTFGLRDIQDRAQRAQRALRAHEAWECEHEFWTGEKIPTNFHLAAGPADALVGNHRTITAWSNPTSPGDVVYATPETLGRSLALLDQAIADADAGIGMIHATPYLVQLWASKFPFLRTNDGRIMTVNFNLIVPGYGYPGSGPARHVTDAHVTSGSTALTSATAAFTQVDVGAAVVGADVPAGTTIASVTNATTAVLSANATGTSTAEVLTFTDARRTTDDLQWAYATEMVYKLRGDVNVYPNGWDQMGGQINLSNDVEIRAERSWAFITNRLLRAAVLVDTTA